MNTKQVLTLFGVCSIFLIALLLRPNLPGGDTYYFVNYITGITDVLPAETSLSVWIMDMMPSSFIIIKVIMFWLTFLSCLAISLTGELFEKKTGWLAGIILLCTVFFTTIFINFENDIFSFVFIAWSMFFVSKFRKTDEQVWLYLSIICIGVAGLVWQYAVYFLIPLLILSRLDWKYFLVSAVIILSHLGRYISGMLPSFHFQEQMPFMSLMAIVFFTACYTKELRNKELFPLILFATAMALINLKQTYVLMPILAIAMATAIPKMDLAVRLTTIISLSVVLAILVLTIITMYPNHSTNELFDKAQSLQKYEYTNLDINPYWDFGYYWAYYTKDSSLIFENREDTPKTGIVITREFDKTLNGVCLQKFDNKTGKIYVCQ